MKEHNITNNKKACVILAVCFWGLLLFFELGGKLLLALFPEELLSKYANLVFYGTFFFVCVVVFRKAFLCAIKDFIGHAKKYAETSGIFLFIALVLMVASAIFLDSVGIGDSSNQQMVESAVSQYGFLHIIIVCFAGPVVEEVFYRGILFGLLKGKEHHVARGVLAVVVTALLFAVSHSSIINFSVTELLSYIPIFLLGLTLTSLYWKTDNILCSILVHIVINSISVFG